MDGEFDGDTTVFDVRSPTRDNGGRRASATTNNNTEGLSDTPQTPKAVRSNSENTDPCEKTCITTMSGSSIA